MRSKSLIPSCAGGSDWQKEDSRTTVVWNPWSTGAQTLADLGDDGWRSMACVEASNIRDFAVDLAPGQQHTMKTVIQIV